MAEIARASLGKSWHSFQLEATQKIGAYTLFVSISTYFDPFGMRMEPQVGSKLFHDPPARQWILSTAPYLFAQVWCRLA